MDRHFATAALALALLFPPAGPLQAQPSAEDLKPVETEILAPITVEPGDYTGPAAPRSPGPVSTLPPDVYEALKKDAETNPDGEVPDEFVPLVFPKESDLAVGPAAPEAGGISSVTSAATVARSIAGLDHAASVASDGLYRPPDTTLGKSGSRILEGTNSALRLSTADGTALDQISLNAFFGANPTTEGVLFDPRVVYDRLGPNQRFFVVALSRNDIVKTAGIHVAVSRSANPANLAPASWCTYKMSSLRDQGTTWADYPMVGVGADTFLISNDQFTFDLDPLPDKEDYEYKYAILRVIRKDLVTNNAANCPAFSSSIFLLPIQLMGTAGSNLSLGHVQPAIHYTPPSSFPTTTNPVYMVSTVPPPSSTYKVWRVKNAATGSPTVSVLSLTAGDQYQITFPKQPPGGVSALDINDARIMQVAAIGDNLWATHQTRCQQPSGLTKPCIRVLLFFVHESGGNMTAIFQHDVTLASPPESLDLGYYMPGIAVNSSQQTAISFLASSPILPQSAAWTLKYYLDQFYGPATVFASGSCARSHKKVGDFVGAQTNPNDLVSFWLAGEAAVPYGSACYWRTQIVQVIP